MKEGGPSRKILFNNDCVCWIGENRTVIINVQHLDVQCQSWMPRVHGSIRCHNNQFIVVPDFPVQLHGCVNAPIGCDAEEVVEVTQAVVHLAVDPSIWICCLNTRTRGLSTTASGTLLINSAAFSNQIFCFHLKGKFRKIIKVQFALKMVKRNELWFNYILSGNEHKADIIRNNNILCQRKWIL